MFRNLSDLALGYADTLDLDRVVDENDGKHVEDLKKLGQGDMDGAVFLAQDEGRNRYAQRRVIGNAHDALGRAA